MCTWNVGRDGTAEAREGHEILGHLVRVAAAAAARQHVLPRLSEGGSGVRGQDKGHGRAEEETARERKLGERGTGAIVSGTMPRVSCITNPTPSPLRHSLQCQC